MLTTVEVATILGVSPRRVRALKTRIGFVKRGRDLLFRPSAVRRFLAARGRK